MLRRNNQIADEAAEGLRMALNAIARSRTEAGLGSTVARRV